MTERSSSKDHFYSIRAFRRYRRYLFHALRNQKNLEDAADEAMEKTRAEMIQLIREQETGITELDITEQWGNILQYLIEWQILLINLPLDKERLPKASDSLRVNPDKIMPPSPDSSESECTE